jgi:hypothetical protein
MAQRDDMEVDSFVSFLLEGFEELCMLGLLLYDFSSKGEVAAVSHLNQVDVFMEEAGWAERVNVACFDNENVWSHQLSGRLWDTREEPIRDFLAGYPLRG